MLPDYPQVKAKLMKFHMEQMFQAHQRRLGPFGQIKSSVMHEGVTDLVVREDGSVDEIAPRRMRIEGIIPADSPDIEALNVEDIQKAMLEAGRDLADEKAKMIVERIEETTKKVGTHIGPHSDPAEQIFEMIEKRCIDFDREGMPLWGQIISSRETAETIRATMQRIDSTPDLKERMELLIEQKRREFLDREAARKLVG